MILVGQYDSPFVRRVAITLNLYGMKFTRNAISVFSNAKEMAQINPVVRIPSLILDDGGILIDSGAIIDYLDGLAGPERALTPASGTERQMVPSNRKRSEWRAPCATNLQRRSNG